ncbi:hypothetical protein N7470_002241 [Penicillium chermesinum]|nr:hypothetical protein N7470_002241 [Penicillium chermesinum]
MVGPTVSLSGLRRADGSASYKCPVTGYDVLGAVNAPVELPARKDALRPEDATIEVFVKPGNTTAGVGERYVESVLRSVLGSIVLGREAVERGDSYLTILPALLHASLLALISAAVPLSMTFATTLLAVTPSGQIVQDPPVEDVANAVSLHVLAFSSKGHLLLNESQGRFDFETWEANPRGSDGDTAMDDESKDGTLDNFIREAMEDHLHRVYSWKIESN